MDTIYIVTANKIGKVRTSIFYFVGTEEEARHRAHDLAKKFPERVIQARSADHTHREPVDLT